MERSGRRILLAVEPAVLERALAKLVTARFDDEVVQLGQAEVKAFDAGYDAAIVSVESPDDVRADVVIALPDTRGSAGTATVRDGERLQEVPLVGAKQVMALIDQYVPRR